MGACDPQVAQAVTGKLAGVLGNSQNFVDTVCMLQTWYAFLMISLVGRDVLMVD